MKESIQRSGNEVAIVMYNAPLPPKYFRLSKKFLRTLFVVTPIVLVSLLGGLFIWGLGTRFREVPSPTFPVQMSASEIKISSLETELSQLKYSNVQLVEKLAAQGAGGAAKAAGEDPYLMNIRRPYGMQNFISKNLVTADQFEFVQEPGKTALKFQIISTTLENRVTGHVLVFMVSDSGTIAYPKAANASLGEGVKYTLGEPFAVARLRPTNAVFETILNDPSAKFLIYIFSREGDLLLIKETQSFSNEAKK
jgi:hypothetical protein